MSMQTMLAGKSCCKCGQVLSGLKRMKDSSGNYWCVPCGQRDEAKKALAAGGVCAACAQVISPAEMIEVAGLPYCRRCAMTKQTSPGRKASRFKLPQFKLPSFGFGSRSYGAYSGGIDKQRLIKMLGFVVLLAAISAFVNFVLF